jgi:hypothetical protein
MSWRTVEKWPAWLATDIPECAIWSLEHESAPTIFRGRAMHLVDRANNCLPLLLTEPALKSGEIAFVTHSFGGLIIAELLRVADGRSTAERHVANHASASAFFRVEYEASDRLDELEKQGTQVASTAVCGCGMRLVKRVRFLHSGQIAVWFLPELHQFAQSRRSSSRQDTPPCATQSPTLPSLVLMSDRSFHDTAPHRKALSAGICRIDQ